MFIELEPYKTITNQTKQKGNTILSRYECLYTLVVPLEMVGGATIIPGKKYPTPPPIKGKKYPPMAFGLTL